MPDSNGMSSALRTSLSVVPPALNIVGGFSVPASTDVLIDIMRTLGPNAVKINFVDPAASGVLASASAGLFELYNVSDTVSTLDSSIRAVLTELRVMAMSRFKHPLADPTSSYIGEYIKTLKAPLVVLVADLSSQELSDVNFGLLVSLMLSGPSVGVGFILAHSPTSFERFQTRFFEVASRQLSAVSDVVLASDPSGPFLDFVSSQPFDSPPRFSVSARRQNIEVLVKHAASTVGQLSRLLERFDPEVDDHSVRLCLGVDGNGFVVDSVLGDRDPHGLVIGRSGAGKSTFLHQVISGLTSHYTPEQLQLWIYDLKGGNEFADYSPQLGGAGYPHVNRLILDSDPELAQLNLQALTEELASRAELFRRHRVRDMASARAAGLRLPRILAILDEFEVIFTINPAAADHMLGTLTRKGRAYGIHILLTSQHLGSNGTVPGCSSATIEQCTLRMTIGLGPVDRGKVLGYEDAAVLSPSDEAADLDAVDLPGTAYAYSSLIPAPVRFEFPPPDHQWLLSTRTDQCSPLTIVSGEYATALDEFGPKDAGVPVGRNAKTLEPVLVPLRSRGAGHVLVMGRDVEAVAWMQYATYMTQKAQLVKANRLGYVLDIGRGKTSMIDIDTLSHLSSGSESVDALVAALRDGTRIVAFCSSAASARRIFGSNYVDAFSRVLLLEASGFDYPDSYVHRPEMSRAVLLDVSAETLQPIVLFGRDPELGLPADPASVGYVEDSSSNPAPQASNTGSGSSRFTVI